MKRVIALLLVVAMLFLVSCRGKNNLNASSETTSTDTSVAAETSSAASTTSTTSDKSVTSNNVTTSHYSAIDNSNKSQPQSTTPIPETVNTTLKKGINLSSPFESADEVDYDSWVLNKDYYLKIKQKGFDHVRIPVNFPAHAIGAPDYTVDKEFLHQVDTAIDCALDTGLVAILDFHGWSNMNKDADGNKQIFYKIWEQIAIRYQNYPANLFFELLNEPDGKADSGTSPLTNGKLNEIQNEAIRIIRQTNPTRTLVAAVNGANGAWNIWDISLPVDDKNIIVSIHNYSSMKFTHQGANWLGFSSNRVTLTQATKDEITSNLKNSQNYMIKTGRTVWISEWGIYLGTANHDDVSEYMSFFRKQCEERGLPWCLWEFCVGFGAYDLTNDTWKDYITSNLFD